MSANDESSPSSAEVPKQPVAAFDFVSTPRILFGAGLLREAGRLAAGLGLRAWVVSGRSDARVAPLLARLDEAGVQHRRFVQAGEPSLDDARRATADAKEHGADVVVAFGGGAVLDLGKAVAALLTNGGDPLDYLEVIGAGRPLALPSLPVVAIPTTAGTGSEATRNAVLHSPEHGVKASLRSPGMLPRVALIDPELAIGLPPAVTASTGLDALTQVLEPFVCNCPNPLADAVAREGLRRAAGALRAAYHHGDELPGRASMAIVSLCGGMALANARLGAVHGFAAPIGGAFAAPHGAVCAALLPHVVAINLQALRARTPASPSVTRYDEATRLLLGRDDVDAEALPAWLGGLCAELCIQPLRAWGLAPSDAPTVIAAARSASSMKGNPIALSDGELAQVFERAL